MKINQSVSDIEGLFLLLMGILIQMSRGFQPRDVIIPLLVLMVMAILFFFRENKWGRCFIYIVIVIASAYFYEFVIYIPFLFFIYFREQDNNAMIELVLTVVRVLFLLPTEREPAAFCGLLLAQAFLAGIFLRKWQKLNIEYSALQDTSFESQKKLEQKNRELTNEQDQLLTLEIANERNRIARDIHDNVGHLLSSALLQIAAIETLNQQDTLKEPYTLLRETLNEGMDNIRQSVHNLHDGSLKLSHSTEALFNQFSYCPLEVEGTFPDYLSHIYNLTILAVLKEALNNIMKHSNGNFVKVQFQVFPAFYKLTIYDNGTEDLNKGKDLGIGLQSLQKRLEKINGYFSVIKYQTGFTLITILPKNEKS